MKAALEVRELTVHYQQRPVLVGVDYEARPGRLIGVIGPNGAGKSTFLKACMGIVRPSTGAVSIGGRPLDEARATVAYVPQREAVDWDFPVTALEVVLMGLYGRIGWLRRIRGQHRDRALAMLDRVRMSDLADRPIGRLSGGQQQRVFLARALVQDPELFLLDEAIAGVDVPTEELLLDLFTELRDAGKTLLLVHHDLDTVRARCDEALLLNGRKIADGEVARVLDPEVLQKGYGEKLLVVEMPGARTPAAAIR